MNYSEIKKEIEMANNTNELDDIVEKYLSDNSSISYSEEAELLREHGENKRAELLEIAEKKWFEIE